MKYCGFLILLFMASCGNESIYRPVAVEYPAPVPCASAVPKPLWPLDNLPRDAGFYEKVRALMAENETRKAYEIQLEAALAACRGEEK
jgi:hypothetical protein